MNQFYRPLYGIFCLIAAIFSPYWITYILVFVGYLFFDWYIEGVIAVLVSDIVFGVPLERFLNIALVGMMLHAILFALVEIGKRFTRYGNS